MPKVRSLTRNCSIYYTQITKFTFAREQLLAEYLKDIKQSSSDNNQQANKTYKEKSCL